MDFVEHSHICMLIDNDDLEILDVLAFEFRLYREFFMVVIYLFYYMYILPVNLVYVRYHCPTKWLTFAIDMIISVSIVSTFFIGYFDYEEMYVHMRLSQVAKKYLKTYFIFDVMGGIPSYLIEVFLEARGPTYLNFLKWFMAFRLFGFRSFSEALDIFRLKYGFSSATYVSLQIGIRTISVLLFCVGLAAFFRQFPYNFIYITDEEDKVLALSILFNTVAEMFGVGKVPNFEKYGEAVQFVLFPVLSMLLHFWIISKFYTLWQRVLLSSQLGEDNTKQIESYLTYQGLPRKTRDEVYCYFDFRYQKKFYNESAILGIISSNLRKEIPNYKVGRAVEKVKFLKGLPNDVIMTIISNMELFYFSPGDVVFKAGTVSKSLYFIKFGTVALFDSNNVEICHLEDNSYYGDTSVVIRQIHQVTMMAISPCEIGKLNQSTLLEILDTFPNLKEQVFSITQSLMTSKRKNYDLSSNKSRLNLSAYVA